MFKLKSVGGARGHALDDGVRTHYRPPHTSGGWPPTVIHQGAYGVPMVVLVLLAYLLRLVHPVVLQIVATYNLAQFLWIYGWTFPYPPRLDGLAITAMALAGILSLAMLTAGAWSPASPVLRLRHGKLIVVHSAGT